MRNLLILIAVVILIYIQTEPAFCQTSKTTVFQISVTIPEHVIFNNNATVKEISNNIFQFAQTQTVIRNNKTIRLTSIVVP